LPRIPLIAAGALAAVSALAACSGASGSKATPTLVSVAGPSSTVAGGVPAARTITATGQGQASGTPDLLTVSIGVQTSGPTARAVLAANSTEAAALIAKLQADGVAAKDIQTSQLSLNPVYAPPNPNQAPRLTGYSASDIVTVNIHQLDKAGTILDDAAAAGGNDTQIQSVSYSVQNTGPLLAAARADAVHQADTAAKAMAAAAGVALGQVRYVTDVVQPQAMPYATALGSAAGAAAPGSVPVPVQPGTQQVTAEVIVSYEVA
jgi:uncharacterized protein YggE